MNGFLFESCPGKKAVVRAGTATVLALAALGCSGFANPDAVSRHISGLTGVAVERQGGVTIGANALRLARIGIAAADAQSPELLDNLKDFKVGVYRLVGADDLGRNLTDADFARYQTVAQVDTGGDDVLLLSRGSMGSIRELLAIIDSGAQFTVVQVRGDLEGLLEEAVRLALARADRQDLTQPLLQSLQSSGTR